jgi:hypothetical protein
LAPAVAGNQKSTGSVFGVSALWPKSAVAAIEGKSTVWRRISESGRWIDSHFCPTCGSTLYWYAEALPDSIGISAGNFADPNFEPPGFAFWSETQHPWVKFKAAGQSAAVGLGASSPALVITFTPCSSPSSPAPPAACCPFSICRAQVPRGAVPSSAVLRAFVSFSAGRQCRGQGLQRSPNFTMLSATLFVGVTILSEPNRADRTVPAPWPHVRGGGDRQRRGRSWPRAETLLRCSNGVAASEPLRGTLPAPSSRYCQPPQMPPATLAALATTVWTAMRRLSNPWAPLHQVLAAPAAAAPPICGAALRRPGSKRIAVRPRLLTDNTESVRAVALAGAGLAALPNWMVSDALAAGQLTRVLPDHPGPTSGIYAVYPGNRLITPAVRAFVERLVRELRARGMGR